MEKNQNTNFSEDHHLLLENPDVSAYTGEFWLTLCMIDPKFHIWFFSFRDKSKKCKKRSKDLIIFFDAVFFH